MKLLIVLSLIAYGYAAKLDRTYLPPASAGTAGGSPGSLTAPGQESSFGQQAPGFRGSQAQPGRAPFDQKSGVNQPSGPSRFGQGGPIQAGFGQPSGLSNSQVGPSQSGFGRPGQSGFGQNRPNQPSNFGQPSGNGVQPPGLGQPQFGQPGPRNQGSFTQNQQPERPQAAADRNAEILRYDNQNDGETFAYSFETSNGIAADESGVATNGVQAEGGYSYTGDDGQFYKITYTADENGYVPQGDHLPTPPPIPDEIQRSIEENARAAASGTQEGAYNPDEDDSPQQYNGAYNQGQSQQQPFRGSNGFSPSGTAGQSQARPQGPGFQATNQQAYITQEANQPGFSSQNRRQGQNGVQGQAQPGYDYSRPQNQGRQPNGNANSIPSGPSKAPGFLNQGRPFQGQDQPSQSESNSNQVQYQPLDFNQPQRPQSGNQAFGPTGTQFNQGTQGNKQPGNQGLGSQFNQNKGFRPTGSSFNQESPNFGQKRPNQNNQQQLQQSFQNQRDSQGSQGQRGQGNGGFQNQDGYEYNRPQGTFNSDGNSGNQGQFQPQSQGSGSGSLGGFPGSGPQGQSRFPGSFGSNRPGASQGQSQGAFPGSTGSSRPGGQSQPEGQQGFPGPSGVNRPGSSQGSQFPKGQSAPQYGQQPQRQETFGGPRQKPSFSPEEGYKY